MDIIAFILVIVLFVSNRRLKERVEKVEKHLNQMSGYSPETPAVADETISPIAQPVSRAQISEGTMPQQVMSTEHEVSHREQPFKPAGPTWADNFAAWVKEDWLLKLGALLLIIGFAWFVTYAIKSNWIGPMGQITLGLVIGASLMAFSWMRIQKYRHQGSIFLLVGSTIVLLTLIAGREVYDFFTPLSSLVMMFITMAFVALVSVRMNVRFLAYVGIFLAGIAPFLGSQRIDDHGLFLYLLVVTAGTLGVIALRSWKGLTLLSLIIYSGYSMLFIDNFGRFEHQTLLIYAFIFAALFFIVSILGMLHDKTNNRSLTIDLITSGLNGFLLLGWIIEAGASEWQTLLILVWALVFAVGAFLVFKRTRDKKPFLVHALVSIVMIGVATANEFNGSALTLAFTIETALLPLVIYAVLRDLKMAVNSSYLMILPVALSFQNILSRGWRTSAFGEDFWILVLVLVALAVVGSYLNSKRKPSIEDDHVLPGSIHLIFSSVYGYALLWLVIHALIPQSSTATIIVLVIYTIIGIVKYFYGVFNSKKFFVAYGGLVLGLVVLRLLFVEVWQMELGARIVVFFLVGILLMATAFITKKKKETVLEAPINYEQ